MSGRLLAGLLFATVVLGGVIRWIGEKLFEHGFTEWLLDNLSKYLGLTEAEVMTFILANAIPLALGSIIVFGVYFLGRRHGPRHAAVSGAPLTKAAEIAERIVDKIVTKVIESLPSFKFIFSSGMPFEELQHSGRSLVRCVRFGLRNEGIGWLSNCNVFITKISPGHETIAPWRLNSDGFDLQSNQPTKYFDLAYYNETSGGQPDNKIVIPIVPTPGFVGTTRMLPPGRYIITLEATSKNAIDKKAYCHLSVDGGRLSLREHK